MKALLAQLALAEAARIEIDLDQCLSAAVVRQWRPHWHNIELLPRPRLAEQQISFPSSVPLCTTTKNRDLNKFSCQFIAGVRR